MDTEFWKKYKEDLTFQKEVDKIIEDKIIEDKIIEDKIIEDKIIEGGATMDLQDTLDKKVTEEFRGVLEYDEIIEAMPKEHTKHIESLRGIQKQQAIHVLELTNMIMDMGYPEPKIIQQLEDFLKIKEY